MIEFDRPSESRVTLELTPLIDVIFLLLIFFMLSSTFIYPALDLRLPSLQRSGVVDPLQRIVVSVSESGELFINKDPVAEAEFGSTLAQILKRSDNKAVYLRVDSQVAYGKFMTLLDEASRAGASDFNLLYEPSK